MSGSEHKHKRLHYITVMQIIAMGLIVLSHSVPDNMEIPHWMNTSVPYLQYAGLVIFIWASAYLAYITNNIQKSGYLSFIKKKCLRLLLPYFACSVLMLIPKTILQEGIQGVKALNGLDVLYQFITPRYGILPHLWFLPTLFILMCLMPMWLWLANSRVRLALSIAVLTAMQFLPGITKVFCMDDIIFYALWFLLGVVCAKYGLCNAKEKNSGNEVIDRTKINYNIMLPSVIIFGGYIMNRILGINSTLSVVLYELLVLSLMITGAGMVQKHLASFSARFGKFTYPIYIMSLPIQNMIGLIAVKIGWGTEVTYWILFVAGIVILYVVSELILLVGRQPKLRWIQYVVGL